MAIRLLVLVLIVSACSRATLSSPPGEPLAQAPQNHLVVTETNYESGMLEVFDLTSADKPRQFPIHSDAVARAPRGSGSIFVLNRFKADSLLALTPDLSTKQGSYTLEAESNPQDIQWVSPGLAIVSRLHSPDLLFIHPGTGKEQGKISLAKYGDADGVPEMAWMARDGESVAVALQTLKDFFPATVEQQVVKSKVVVYDLKSQSVKDYPLAYCNPVTEFKRGPAGDWYLGEAGYTGWASKIDGGIERLAAQTFEPKGMIVTEQALGGDVIDFEIISEKLGVAIVGVPAEGAAPAKSLLVSFDPSTGAKLALLETAEGGQLQQLLLDRPRGLFYVVDRHTTQFGIRVFSSTTLKEDTAKKRATKLPPYHLSWMD